MLWQLPQLKRSCDIWSVGVMLYWLMTLGSSCDRLYNGVCATLEFVCQCENSPRSRRLPFGQAVQNGRVKSLACFTEF